MPRGAVSGIGSRGRHLTRHRAGDRPAPVMMNRSHLVLANTQNIPSRRPGWLRSGHLGAGYNPLPRNRVYAGRARPDEIPASAKPSEPMTAAGVTSSRHFPGRIPLRCGTQTCRVALAPHKPAALPWSMACRPNAAFAASVHCAARSAQAPDGSGHDRASFSTRRRASAVIFDNGACCSTAWSFIAAAGMP